MNALQKDKRLGGLTVNPQIRHHSTVLGRSQFGSLVEQEVGHRVLLDSVKSRFLTVALGDSGNVLQVDDAGWGGELRAKTVLWNLSVCPRGIHCVACWQRTDPKSVRLSWSFVSR